MRWNSVSAFPGKVAGVSTGVGVVFAATFDVTVGLICSPTITKRLIAVPGGSQVMSVAVACLSVGPKTATSVGLTIFLL